MRIHALFIAVMVLTGLVVGSVLPPGALCGGCDCGVTRVAEVAAAADHCCGGGEADRASDDQASGRDHERTHDRSAHPDGRGDDGAGCECVRCFAGPVKVPAASDLGVVADLSRGPAPAAEMERPAAVCGDGLMDPPRS